MPSKSTEELFRRVARPIFEASAKEIPKTTGRLVVQRGLFHMERLIQPHNFRRYFDFHKGGFSPPISRVNQPPVSSGTWSYCRVNHGSEHLFKNYRVCTVNVKKSQIVITNLRHGKQWRHIVATKRQDIDARLCELEREMEGECIDTLKSFLNEFGGMSNFKILKRTQEWKPKELEFLNRVPKDMVIHDSLYKMVYPQQPEMYQREHAANFIKNAALHEFAPEITDELKKISRSLGTLSATTPDNRELEPDPQPKDHLNDFNAIYAGLYG